MGYGQCGPRSAARVLKWDTVNGDTDQMSYNIEFKQDLHCLLAIQEFD